MQTHVQRGCVAQTSPHAGCDRCVHEVLKLARASTRWVEAAAGILSMTRTMPILHTGHFRCSADDCGSAAAGCEPHSGRSVRHRPSAARRLRFARKPKCRILTKPRGKTCSRNRRINSTASMVISFCRFPSAESLHRKVSWPFCRLIRRPLEIATRCVSQELLTPSMQDGEYANLGARMAWVCGNGEQGLRDRAKQNAVDGPGILKRQHC